ncbi:MAG: cadherin-like beta sandwich domain-containing protein, partial [Gammaproteobacteria bacterium]|nr:cadherin-like beta sandwich domain-containing protein [Gammaproteobacteria bacterium]
IQDIFNNVGGALAGSNEGGTISNSHWSFEAQLMLYASGSNFGRAGSLRDDEDFSDLFSSTKALQTSAGQDDSENSLYYQWTTADWDFGSIEKAYPQYPLLKYIAGTYGGLSACGVSAMPRCGSILPHQFDIDEDNDGLIEIRYMEDLDAMRYQPDGAGYRASSTATLITTGCPIVNGKEQCKGYELTRFIGFGSEEDTLEEASFYYWRPETNREVWAPRGYLARQDYGGWLPIGTAANKFSGVFDGNLYLIYDLWIKSRSSAGLFGDIASSAEIRNFILDSSEVTGSNEVGVLAANNEGSVANVGISSGEVTGGSDVGGLIGRNVGTVTHSYTHGLDITCGSSQWYGGLVGRNSGGMISYSYADVPFISYDRLTCAENSQYVGGLVGGNTRGGIISHSFSNMAVVGYDLVGGLAGINVDRSIIIDSYAIGNVRATGESSSIGGLVGFNIAEIVNSYATGIVFGGTSRGGLAGFEANKNLVKDSYWDTELSGIPADGDHRALTSTQLQTPTTATGIYRNWRTSDWDFGSDAQHPVLKSPRCANEINPSDCKTLLDGQRLGLQKMIFSPGVTVFPKLRNNLTVYDLVIPGADINFDITPFVDNTQGLRLLSINDNVLDDGQTYTIRRDSRLRIQKNENFTSYSSSYVLYRFYINNLIAQITHDDELLDDGDVVLLHEGDSTILTGSLGIYGAPRVPSPDAMLVRDEIEAGEHTDHYWVDLSDDDFLAPISKKQTVISTPQVPVDKIKDMNSNLSEDINLKFVVSYRETISSKTIVLSIVKKDNGSIELGAPRLQDTDYVIDVNLREDIDGVNPNPMIAYQWQTREEERGDWRDIAGATSPTHTLRYVVPTHRYRANVTYTDGQNYRKTVSSYGITYRGVGSDDTSLKKLELRDANNTVGLQPAFVPGSMQTTLYSAEVANRVDTVTLVADASHVVAGVSIDGDDFTIDERRVDIDLDARVTSVTVTVRAANGAEQSYTVVVHKLSDNADLANITISPSGNLPFLFNPDINRYVVSVSTTTETFRVTAQAQEGRATVSINNNPSSLRVATANLTLANVGETKLITILVLSADRTVRQSYTLEVTREIGREARLKRLLLYEGASATNLVDNFDGNIMNYLIPVSSRNIDIRAETMHINATVTVSCDICVLGTSRRATHTLTQTITLADNNRGTLVKINSTSADVTTTNVYMFLFIVLHDSDNVAFLTGLGLSPDDIHLQPNFASDLFDYDINTLREIRYLQLTPMLSSTASAIINIVSSANPDFTINASNGVQSDAIVLDPLLETIITITVTTHILDDYISLVYVIKVKQDPDGDGVFNEADIDDDGDGLIELYSLEDLNAMRRQLDGSGYKDSEGNKNTTGCPADDGCIGYELTGDLDFKDNASYGDTENRAQNKAAWTKGSGWSPIVTFAGIFKGNGYTISNLYINRRTHYNVALFASITNVAKIDYVNLSGVNIRGRNSVAGLVGQSAGKIANSSVSGNITGILFIGGLVGFSNEGGRIINSYADIDVLGQGAVGGLVGHSRHPITNSYATGTARATQSSGTVGGLVGFLRESSIKDSYAAVDVRGPGGSGGIAGDYANNDSSITNTYVIGRVLGANRNAIIGFSGLSIRNSYWNSTVNPDIVSYGAGEPRTTAELKEGTPLLLIYTGWEYTNWDFGSAKQYPGLKYAIGDADDPACRAETDMSVGLPICGTLLPNQLHRPPDSYLTDLTITPVSDFSPQFDSFTKEYSASVVNAARTVTVAAESGFNTTIRISANGVQHSADYKLSADIPLKVGDNTVNIELTDSGGMMNSYVVVINREIDLSLADLESSSPATPIEPTFASDVFDYHSNVPLKTRQIRLIPTASDADSVRMRITSSADADFAVNVGSGVISDAIPLNASFSTRITITVSVDAAVSNATLMYHINVTKDHDDDGVPDVADRDDDNNGLIEIHSLEDLNAVRRQLDGSGYTDSNGNKDTTGCLADGGCIGYELARHLDFKDDASYSDTENRAQTKTAWTEGEGWTPIGTVSAPFTSIFNGNGYTISNLHINRTEDDIGLFGAISNVAKINYVNLSDVDIRGQDDVGGLAGQSFGTIANSSVTGRIVGNLRVGGLVGVTERESRIINSYADTNVTGVSRIGGLVGYSRGSIANSYAAGTATGVGDSAGDDVGGLTGIIQYAAITNSYAVADVSGPGQSSGIAGSLAINGSITNSYAIGKVLGFRRGGITDRYNQSVVNSYWNKSINPDLGSDGSGTSKTTAELKEGTPS